MPAYKKDFVLSDGTHIDLFYIGTLANALGRSTNTIRKWEISGVLPPTIFKDSLGSRLYSQAQIDAVVMCAEKAKIKQGYSIANTSFSTWCYKEFERLHKLYTRTEK